MWVALYNSRDGAGRTLYVGRTGVVLYVGLYHMWGAVQKQEQRTLSYLGSGEGEEFPAHHSPS